MIITSEDGLIDVQPRPAFHYAKGERERSSCETGKKGEKELEYSQGRTQTTTPHGSTVDK
jgi:hypothetical protein